MCISGVVTVVEVVVGEERKLRWDHTWLGNVARSLAFCLSEMWHY